MGVLVFLEGHGVGLPADTDVGVEGVRLRNFVN